MNYTNKIVNIVIALFTIWMIAQYILIYFQNQKFEKSQLTTLEVTGMNGEEIDLLSPPKKPLVLFFWSTTCPPCMLEMKRLEMAVENKELPSEQLILINMFEEPAVIKKYFSKKNSPLTSYIATSELIKKLQVSVTPTIIHIDQKGTIHHFSSGVGPLTIYRAKKFLKSK